jgi:copper resistance protein C
VRARIAVAGIVLGVLAVPVLGSAAFAHDSLVDADPAADAAVTSLESIALTFSAEPIDGGDYVQVTGPDGRYYETGCPTLDGPVATTEVALGPAGEYEVLWRIVSSDGHPVSESYSFTYDGEPVGTGTDDPACAAPESPDAKSSDTETPAASGDSGLWLGLGLGGLAAVVVGVGAWLLIRRPAKD